MATTTIATLEKIARAFKLELYELFHFQGMPGTADKEKIAILDEIYNLLKNEQTDILNFTILQARFIISMKESFVNCARK
jgi:hypothetical protein